MIIRFFHPRHYGQCPPTSKDFYPRCYPLICLSYLYSPFLLTTYELHVYISANEEGDFKSLDFNDERDNRLTEKDTVKKTVGKKVMEDRKRRPNRKIGLFQEFWTHYWAERKQVHVYELGLCSLYLFMQMR